MSGIREAFALTFLERYLGLILNLGTLVVISRLLTPAEVGIAAIGWAVLAIPYAFRDLGAMDYIVQRKDLSPAQTRTAATVCLGASVLLVALILASAPGIARLFAEPGIGAFLSLMAVAVLTDAIATPLVGLMRRDLEFRRVAVVNATLHIVSCVVTIGLAVRGHSYMSIAWAGVAGNAAATTLALLLKPGLWVFRPSLAHWRDVVSSGLYFSSMAALARAYEALPYLALGRFQQIADSGHFNRAMQTCQLPDKVLLAGITSVAFPVLAAEAREGRELKPSYLAAVEMITAVSWPAYALLALLAPRVVEILFGPQWEAVVPLVQIMAVASLCGAASSLSYPMLYAVGHPRVALAATMCSLPVSGVIIVAAAMIGTQALALSMLVTVAFNNIVALCFIKRLIKLSWRELLATLRKSLLVTLASISGPVAIVLANGMSLHLSMWLQLAMVGLAGVTWLGALYATSHRLLHEVRALTALGAAVLRRARSPRPPPAGVEAERG